MKNYQVFLSFTVAVFLQVSCQKNVVTPEQGIEQRSITYSTLPVCGQLRTQSPGGWGSTPAGNNPGTYLHNNFSSAFAWNLMIGCRDGQTISLTSAQAITNLMPAAGKPAVLDNSYTDPTVIKNTLVGQLVALTLSVRFDEYDANFGAAETHLGDMIIGSGVFQGISVNDFLQKSNDVIGGCSTAYSIENITNTASRINNNYLDGTVDMAFLQCPEIRPRDAEVTR